MMRAAVAAFVALLVVGACARPDGAPSPTDSAPLPSADRFGAPVPSRSLDATRSAQEPCSALTEAQLRALALEPTGRLDDLPIGAACVWEGPGFSREVAVTLFSSRDLLVDTYRSRAEYQYFEPMEIAGLPATAQQTTRGALTCTVTTSISMGQSVDVSATEYGAEPAPACDTAIRATEAVVSNLPPAPQK